MNCLIPARLKIIVFIFCFFISQFSNAQSGFCRIKGTISDKNLQDVVYLIKGDRPHLDLKEMEIIDSSTVSKGYFSFSIPITFTDFYSIKLKNINKGFVLICSPGDIIRIKIDTSNFYQPLIFASKENTFRKNYIDGVKPLIIIMNSYADSSSMAGENTPKSYKFDSLNILWAQKIRQYNLKFLNKNPKNLTSLRMFNSYYFLFSPDSVRLFLGNLPLSLKGNPMVQEIEYKKFFLESELSKISKFFDIHFYDTLNIPFDFKPFYGKLVLIDYWASWCVPCIENIPLLKQIEARFKDRDFVIIGVSLDTDLKRWKNAINRHDIAWPNISDLKATNGPGARFLNVTSIPRYVLIAKDGSIIKDDIKPEEIEKIIVANLDAKN